MILLRNKLLIFIFTKVLIRTVYGAYTCTEDPQQIEGTQKTTIKEGQTVIYICTNGKEFSSGDSVIVSDCTSSGWFQITATCSDNHPFAEACDPEEKVSEPENTERITHPSFNDSYYRVYECVGSKEWLSGRPIRVMPCRNKEWMIIYDICDESCQVPRDCADVAELNIEDDGEYLVVPSGKSDGKISTVHCFLSDTESNHGGSWTLVFRNADTKTSKSKDEYIGGYGDPTGASADYFVGLDFLGNISQNFSDRSIGNVMEILFYETEDSSGIPKYYVTYENLTVGDSLTNHKLISVGTHHGNAGDAMCEHVNTEFLYADDPGTYWWGVNDNNWESMRAKGGNFLTDSMKWAPLNDEDISSHHVIIRIRPYDVDRRMFCPPMVGSDPSWDRTNASIPFNRTVGTEISWHCNGTLFYEGKDGGERTKDGTLKCEAGTPPYWSRNVTLPCTMICPNGFSLREDGLRCFLFSEVDATSFIDASLKCAEKNSTVAVVNTTSDTEGAATGKSYFVNHAKRGTEQTYVEFPIDNVGLNCTDASKTCEATKDNECAVITSKPSYEFQDCNSSMPYVCEVGMEEPKCPFNYKTYNYLCFKVIPEVNTFKQAYQSCAEEGAALAYPTNIDLSITINNNVIKDFDLNQYENNEFFLGINILDGSWDSQEFVVEDTFKRKLDPDNALKFRIFRPSNTEGGLYVAVGIDYQNSSAKTHALCQYPGPIECIGEPPKPMLNMVRDWNRNNSVGTQAFYWCNDGYAVNRNSSYIVQNVTCYSILGEWYPTLHPCEETPVCEHSLPTVGSNNTIQKISNESFYIGGNISYTCPFGLIFSDLRTEINLTCAKHEEGFSYNETELPACNLCSGSFKHNHSTSDWDSKKRYEIDATIFLMCEEGFQFLSGNEFYEVRCSEKGWNTTGIEECVQKCTGSISYGYSNSTWNETEYYTIGSEQELECMEGYQYPSGGRTQKINCTASGWNTTNLNECVQMCTGNLTFGNATSTWFPEDYYLIGSKHEIQCYHGFQYLSGEVTQNVTCSISGWNITGLEECVPKCTGELSYGNAKQTWNPSNYYDIGSTNVIECEKGYQYLSGKAQQDVTCSVKGWNTTGLEECAQMCTGKLSYGNANSTWDPSKIFSIGYTGEMKCNEGYQYLSGEMKKNVTCSAKGWNTTGLEECVEMCKGEISHANANITGDPSGYNKIGSIGEVECSEGYQFLSGEVRKNVTCTEKGWNITGLEKCAEKCTGAISYGNANSTWNPSTHYDIGSKELLKCYDGYQYLSGKTTQNVTCSASGWDTTGLEKCVEKCKGGVTYGNANSTWLDSNTYDIGTVLELQCFQGYQYLSGKRTQNITCSADGWNKTGLQSCVKMCTGPLEYGNANSIWNPDDYYPIGDVQTLKCKDGYQYLSNDTKQNVTCSKNGWDDSNLESCVKTKVCSSNATLKANMEPISSDKNLFNVGEYAQVNCKAGYESAYKETSQSVECTENGWQLSTLQDCSRICEGDPPAKGKHVEPLNITSRGVGDTITYKCESGHFEPMSEDDAPLKEIDITCNENGTWVSPLGDRPLDCVVLCMDDPPEAPQNGTREWDGTSRTKDTSVTYECDYGYYFGNLSATWVITCDGTDWLPYDEKQFTCSKVCKSDPPEAGKGIVPIDITSRSVGTTITYECEEGLYFEPYEGNSDPSTEITIKCSKSGTWDSPLGKANHKCVKLCVEDPPKPPANGTSDWDGKKRIKDTSVTYECNGGYLFGNFSSTWVVTCDGMKWKPYDKDLFFCSQSCKIEDLPKAGERQTYSAEGTYATVGERVIYKCDNFTANKDGRKSYEITCQDSSSWDTPPTGFLCEDACDGPPAEAKGVPNNFTNDYREGVVVHYVCNKTSTSVFQQLYKRNIYNLCSNKKWNVTVIPECVPNERPSTPREVDDYESHYKETADYYHSDIGRDFEPVAPDGQEDAGYETVNGPLGFGDGVYLDAVKEQCMKKEDYIPPSEKCLVSPSSCDDADKGFSVSIWLNHDLHPNTFSGPVRNVDDPTQYKYILSTGGDSNGHPGIAMAMDGHFLIVILSTGGFYYKARVLGQVPSNEWVNIGFVWYKGQETVKVFVNLKEVAIANKMPSGDEGLLSLYPPELIVGCHKDNDNKTYRDFLDAKFDEVAFWMKPLSSDLDNYEVIAFFGGLDRNGTFGANKNLEKMLSNVNFKNPTQANDAMKYLMQAQAAAAAASTEASPTETTNATQSPENMWNITYNAESVEDLKTFIRQVRIIIDEDNVADTMDKEGLEEYLGGSSPLIDLIFGKNKIGIWKALQKDPQNKVNTYDALDLMNTYLRYQRKAVANTLYPNGSKPFCVYSSLNQDFLSVSCKMLLDDLKNKGAKGYCQPNYKVPQLEYPREAWDSPFDRAKVYSSLYLDERCWDRPTSVIFNLYDKLPQIASLRVDPTQISIDKMDLYEMDSRVLIFEVNVDKARTSSSTRGEGEIDTAQPLCKADPDLIDTNPVEVVLEHATKMFPIKRKLLFHENENYTDILGRMCVRWNPDYGTKNNQSLTGAWNPKGCEMEETGYEYSECHCDNFGTYALMAEKTEPIYVNDPPDWLRMVRYILYGVSAGAIIIYTVVVIVNIELKDQLHLLGLNLAVSLLLGSVAMIISDFEGVREDRHMCVGVGTCIHFFYASVGISMFTLGHASFKAITAGIVDGRFKSYMYICWGAPIFLMGLPYVIYLHKLGRDPRCFIGWENEVKYIFFIPQAGCCVMALFWASVILTNLCTPALRKKHLIRDYGSFSCGAALLLIYLAGTWGVGFVAYIRFDFTEPDFYPYFQIMNGASGVVLFLCIGIGSSRFRRRMCCTARNQSDFDEYGDRHQLVQHEELPPPEPQPDDFPPPHHGGEPFDQEDFNHYQQQWAN